MANKVLGKCACPLCGYPAQDVKETSKTNPKPYLCCEDCHAQIFSRGAKSARILKGRIVAKESDHMYSEVVETPAPVKIPEAMKPAALVAPDPVPPVEAQPKPEKTIFDFFS